MQQMVRVVCLSRLSAGHPGLLTVETMSYGKKLFFMVKFPEVLGSTTYTLLPPDNGLLASPKHVEV
jgi:hypothetical protein